MANTDLTSIQINQIDEFILKHVNFNVELAKVSATKKDTICIPIGNSYQLGTLLSQIEQKTAHSFPNLMDHVKYFDTTKNKYLILSST